MWKSALVVVASIGLVGASAWSSGQETSGEEGARQANSVLEVATSENLRNPAIEKSALIRHMEFIAGDERLGREAFTEQSLEVAEYLVSELKKAGVQGGMPDGAYKQAAPFVRTSYKQAPELIFVGAAGESYALEHGVEFRISRQLNLVERIDMEVVHAEAGDVLTVQPAPSKALVFHGKTRDWRKWREVHSSQDWGVVMNYAPGKKKRKPVKLDRPSVKPQWVDADKEEKAPVIKLYGDKDAWIKGATHLTFSPHFVAEEIAEFNVVGVVPGVGTKEEPDLAEEVIVLSAHYDHVGYNPNVEEGKDGIRNGADDDASGVVVLLELAEAYAAGAPPARTVVFLFACAEEKGILGTKFFVKEPPMPLQRIVCNLNLEMLGRPDDLVGGVGKLWLSGYERSSLGPAYREAGIDVVADQRLEQNFFGRSDNIVFVEEGIVGQTLSSYNMHKDYHGVGDDISKIDFDHLTLCASAAYKAALELSSGRLRPTWNEGEPAGY